jgi:hypothetical protein
MVRAIMVAVLVSLAACGPKHTPPSGGGGGGGTGTGGGTSSADPDGPTADAPEKPKQLSRAECEQMIDHVLELGMAQQRASKPPEYVPSEEQVAKIRQQLVAEQLSACLAWSRPQWECVMASTTIEALYTCAEGEAAPPS